MPLLVIAEAPPVALARLGVFLATLLLVGLCSFCAGYGLGCAPHGSGKGAPLARWPLVFLWCAAAALGFAVLQGSAALAARATAGRVGVTLGVLAICGCGVAALSLACAVGVTDRWPTWHRPGVSGCFAGGSFLVLAGRACFTSPGDGPQAALSWLVGEECLVAVFLLIGCYGPAALRHHDARAILHVPGLLLLVIAPLFAAAASGPPPVRVMWFLGWFTLSIMALFVASLPPHVARAELGREAR